MRVNFKLKIVSNYFLIVLGILMIIVMACPESGSSSGGGGSSDGGGDESSSYTITFNLSNANAYNDDDTYFYVFNTGDNPWTADPVAEISGKISDNEIHLETSVAAGNYDSYVVIDENGDGMLTDGEHYYDEYINYELNANKDFDLDADDLKTYTPSPPSP